jgi:hypothetical protein
MFRAAQSQVAWQAARLRRFLTVPEYAQRRITEIRTGVPYVARERRLSHDNERALAHLFPDELD